MVHLRCFEKKNKGTVALLKTHVMNVGHKDNLSKINCVIRQEELCAKTADLQIVMNITVKNSKYYFIK